MPSIERMWKFILRPKPGTDAQELSEIARNLEYPLFTMHQKLYRTPPKGAAWDSQPMGNMDLEALGLE